MKSLVININTHDWRYMRQLKDNIKWMKSQLNCEDYLISTRKEGELLQSLMKKVTNPS